MGSYDIDIKVLNYLFNQKKIMFIKYNVGQA